MERRHYRVLAIWASQFTQEIVESLADYLAKVYDNFDTTAFLEYIDNFRRSN